MKPSKREPEVGPIISDAAARFTMARSWHYSLPARRCPSGKDPAPTRKDSIGSIGS